MKGQFGPDAFVGMVVLAVLGLGGVFFMKTFIQGLTLESFITILDKEIDQRCFYILLSLSKEEYIRAGEEPTGVYINLTEFYGGKNKYMEESYKFSVRLKNFSEKLKEIYLWENITYIDGYIASSLRADKLRENVLNKIKDKDYTIKHVCFLPVYSPGGIEGRGELIIAKGKR